MMTHFLTRIKSPTRNSSIYSIINAVQAQSSKLFPQTLEMECCSKRHMCPNCSKPSRLCLCNRIRVMGLDNPVSVTILQHSLERKHALNSTRIARLGLKNLEVVTVFDVDYEARFVIRVLDPDPEIGFEYIDDQRLESKEAPAKGFEYIDGESKLAKENVDFLEEKKGHLVDDDNGGDRKRQKGRASLNHVPNLDEFMTSDASALETVGNAAKDISEPVISFTIEKHGGISHFSHSLMPPTHEGTISFTDMLDSAVDALAKGFVVRKLLKSRVKGDGEIEEQEEFELKVPPGSVLLFPSEEAIIANDLKATGTRLKNLIVLDGTWAKAKRIYLENPWLRLLPHLKLDLEATSLYRDVRRQPKAGCLSTIESIVYAMKEVGAYPEGLDDLLDVFESMVEDQRRCKDKRLSKISQK